MSDSQELKHGEASGSDERISQQVSKKLSESDLLETQDYNKLLKKQVEVLKERIKELRDIGERLNDTIMEAERGASLGEVSTEPEIATRYSSELEELRKEVEELYQMVLDECHTQNDMIERTMSLRRRTDNKMATLFEQIFAASENVEKQLAASNQRLESASKPDPAELDRRRQLKNRLDKIKRDRCIWFGCIDVHPEELYRINQGQ